METSAQKVFYFTVLEHRHAYDHTGRSRYGPLKKIGNESLRGWEVLLGEFWGATRQRRAEGEAEVNRLLSGSI